MVIDKKYQIFISSTYIDLVEERKNIIETILKMYHIPIGMEMFSAEDEDQWEIIRRTIDASDYYILVLGLRYGSTTNEGISFTQKEYEYALEKNIPILAFLCDENISLEQNKRDDDLTNIKSFRNSVLKNSKMADFWKSTDDLTGKVSIALMMQTIQKPAIGWIRGDKGISEDLSNELTTLSKENRELRETVENLESQIMFKKPKIKLSIDNIFEINEAKFNDYGAIFLPNKIIKDEVEIHLQEFITQDEIDEYNKSIPSQDEIDFYNSKLEKFHKMKKFHQNLILTVCNEGTVKANNIYLDIQFPKEVLVFKKDTKFEEPKSILPFTPIRWAETRYHESLEKLKEPIRKTNWLNFDNGAIVSAQLIDRNILDKMYFDKNIWLKEKENSLTIKLDSLLHTRCREFSDNYKIVPLEIGKYDIKINIICEEYSIAETQIIQLEYK